MIDNLLVIIYILTLFLIALSGLTMIAWSIYILFSCNKPKSMDKIAKIRPILFKVVIALIIVNCLTVLINNFLH